MVTTCCKSIYYISQTGQREVDLFSLLKNLSTSATSTDVLAACQVHQGKLALPRGVNQFYLENSVTAAWFGINLGTREAALGLTNLEQVEHVILAADLYLAELLNEEPLRTLFDFELLARST